MSRLLARYRQEEERQKAYQAVAKAIRESDATIEIRGDPLHLKDPQDLRGIPCIAMGVGGTSPGTDPLRHVISLNL